MAATELDENIAALEKVIAENGIIVRGDAVKILVSLEIVKTLRMLQKKMQEDE